MLILTFFIVPIDLQEHAVQPGKYVGGCRYSDDTRHHAVLFQSYHR